MASLRQTWAYCCGITWGIPRHASATRREAHHESQVRVRQRRPFAFAAGVLVVVGAAAVSAGCGSNAKEAPPSSVVTPPSPTEKGIVGAPPRAFSPGMNAADAISALESEGYTVSVQTGSGDPGHRNPLSQCKIGSIDGLRGDHPPANTTVYLTVNC